MTLTALFLTHQTMMLSVVASNISGVTNGGHGTFNINPQGSKNGIGYRAYENFNLDQGDVANLNFKDVNSFVNLVDKQVVINGIVNSVKNGNFYNGKAVFVSPNGMVVGASGVLNVGSLGAYSVNMTEDQFKNITKNADAIFANNPEMLSGYADGSWVGQGKAPIIINGKVMTTGNVDIATGGKVTIGNGGGVVAGINENQRAVYSSNAAANQLFDQLVNVDNVKTSAGDKFVSNSGNISIVSTGMEVGGNVVNYGRNGETTLRNSTINTNQYGFDNLTVLSGAKIMQKSGTMNIQNEAGNLKLAQGSTVYNGGKTNIINMTDTRVVSDTNNGLYMNGDVESKGDLMIHNTGELGMNVSNTASITTDGNLRVINGHSDGQHGTVATDIPANNNTGAMNIDGNIKVTSGDALFYNTKKGVDGMNINGTVDVAGKSDYYNDGAAGLNVNGTAKAGNDLTMVNTGKEGLTINSPALVTSNKNVNLYNEGTGHKVSTFDNSGMNVQGIVKAAKDVNMTNKNSNVIIGDKTSNKEYVTAGNDINIKVDDGSLLNYGVDKVLLVANGDLTMDVTNGTIGLPVQQGKCVGSGCTGIGVKADGSRDFKKSINGNIKGKVNATTTNTKAVTKPDDLVINYAAIDSDNFNS